MSAIKTWLKENNKYLFIVFAFLVFLSTFTNLDQDVYWHLKNGESLLIHGMDGKDYFSYWGGNFVSHEWLYDILLHFMYQIDGLRLIKLVSFIAIGASLFMSLKVAQKKRNSNLFIYLIPIIIWATSRILLEARPQVASLFFFCLCIYVLENNKHLWLLPVASLLTVNLHGGMAFLIVLVPVLYFISHIFDEETIDVKYLKKLGLMILAMLITLGITPYGFESVTYGIGYPEWTYDRIAEWQVIIQDSGDIWLLFLMLASLAAMAYTKKAKLKDILFMSMGLMLTFIHLRMALIMVPIYIMCACPYLAETFLKIAERFNLPKIKIPIKMNVDILLIMMIAICGFNTFNINLEAIEKTANSSPVIIKNYIEENDIDIENNIMYNDYGYGGYFIFNNYPVFVDGRVDVYTEEYGNEPILIDYFKVWDVTDELEAMIEKYDIVYWSIAADKDLYNHLIDNNIAELLTKDGKYAFLRTIEKEVAVNE